MEEESDQPTEIHVEVEEQTAEQLHGQVLVPISGQETVIIATSDPSQGVPATVTIDQLAHAAHQSYIQIPTTSPDGETTIQQVQIQEAELQHGEAIQTVQIEPGETIQTVHFDHGGETTVHIQGSDTGIPVHIQPAETLQPVQIQSVHMGLTSDPMVVPATQTLQQVVHLSNQPAVTVQAQPTLETTPVTASSLLVPSAYPTEPVTYGWEDLYAERYSPYEGYVESLEDVQRLITAYEISTITKFVRTRCSGKLFGVVRFDRKCRIWWEDIRDTKGVELKYDGTPFVIMGSRMMSCVFGPDNNKNFKIRAQEEKVRLSLSGEDTKKRRTMKTPSKKLGCPACISIRHIVRFPRHEIDFDDISLRRQAAVTLKEDFMDGVRLPYEERFYVRLPNPISHREHPEGEEALAKDSLDERIIAKIHELVAQGFDKPTDIQDHLNVFVVDELFKGATPPPLSWRRFYPRKNDIRNQVYRAKGLKPSRPKDEVALAIQAVGGIEDGGSGGGGGGTAGGDEAATATSSETATVSNKPQLNRLRFQCRDKLKLLLDLTHICSDPSTLQAVHGVLSTLHSEIWKDLLAGRGNVPIKVEDVAAAAAVAKAATANTSPSDAAATAARQNGSTSVESQLSKISWPTTGLLSRPQKKRGRKRKGDTVVDTTNQYAKSYSSKPRASRCDTVDKLEEYRSKEKQARKVKLEKNIYVGPKRKAGRPRTRPLQKNVQKTATAVLSSSEQHPNVQISCDEIGGDEIGGDEIGGDKIGGDEIGGDEIGGGEMEIVTIDVSSDNQPAEISAEAENNIPGVVVVQEIVTQEVNAGGDAVSVIN